MKILNSYADIFKYPCDIHRVLLSGVLSIGLSHFVYLYNTTYDNISIVHTDDYLLIAIVSIVYLFSLSWCFLSSEYNLKLYGRIIVVMSWSVLVHRVFYGVTAWGSTYFDIMFIVGWSAWLPYALMGVSIEQFIEMSINFFKKKEAKTLKVVEGKFNAQ